MSCTSAMDALSLVIQFLETVKDINQKKLPSVIWCVRWVNS